MSLTFRILISFALIALAAYYLLLNPVVDRVERQYLEAAEEPMVDAANILASMLSVPDADAVIVPEPFRLGMSQVKERLIHAQIYNLMKEEILMDFYVTDADGRLVYDSGGQYESGLDMKVHRDVRLTLDGRYGARSTRTDESVSTSSVMYVAAPILHGDAIAGVLSVYKPQKSMLLFIEETKRHLLYLGILATVLFMLLGILLSRWVTSPLRRLTDYADAVSRGERSSLPALPGYHLRVLGETTEAMREALEDRKYVESYVQSLTHEMKSPLAGIRSASELLEEDLPPAQRDRFLGNVRAESERLQALIDQLLALSSLENRKGLGSPTQIDMASVVARVVNHYESNAQGRGLAFVLRLESGLKVLGEEFLLETAVSNLLQNAVDFSPEGGQIEVGLDRHAGQVRLRIQDEGTGIPEYALSRIHDRFYSLPRPGTERKSSGLGLCFVRESVALHGGRMEIRNREDGSGVLASLEIPLVPGR
ncbi:two-component system sensor histidine kinase CreC [Coraliomargarita parva]|uniref:two-component system sensor histidine kinase CreC n=1 Tax=Coraliomargarita parva TaxID=3014050 RepID=UPI0022B55E58|nr:two-component system sensor histidine kinase CreC [Coraliomargarita parva]